MPYSALSDIASKSSKARTDLWGRCELENAERNKFVFTEHTGYRYSAGRRISATDARDRQVNCPDHWLTMVLGS